MAWLAELIRSALGLGVEVLHQLGVARQVVDTPEGPVNKVGSYYVCRSIGVVAARIELDHVLDWWTVPAAIRGLHHPAQAWMVRRALAPC